MHSEQNERGRNVRDVRMALPLQFQSVQLCSSEYRETLKVPHFEKDCFCERNGAWWIARSLLYIFCIYWLPLAIWQRAKEVRGSSISLSVYKHRIPKKETAVKWMILWTWIKVVSTYIQLLRTSSIRSG